MPGATVEVNARNVDSHLFDFSHSLLHFLGGIEIISEFTGEGGGQVVAGIFFDSDPPEYFHFGGTLLDLF